MAGESEHQCSGFGFFFVFSVCANKCEVMNQGVCVTQLFNESFFSRAHLDVPLCFKRPVDELSQ